MGEMPESGGNVLVTIVSAQTTLNLTFTSTLKSTIVSVLFHTHLTFTWPAGLGRGGDSWEWGECISHNSECANHIHFHIHFHTQSTIVSVLFHTHLAFTWPAGLGSTGGILESGGIAKDTIVSAQATLNSTFTSTFMSVIIDIQVTFNWTSNRDAWWAIMIVLEIVQIVQLSLKSTFNSTMTAHSRVHFFHTHCTFSYAIECDLQPELPRLDCCFECVMNAILSVVQNHNRESGFSDPPPPKITPNNTLIPPSIHTWECDENNHLEQNDCTRMWDECAKIHNHFTFTWVFFFPLGKSVFLNCCASKKKSRAFRSIFALSTMNNGGGEEVLSSVFEN